MLTHNPPHAKMEKEPTEEFMNYLVGLDSKEAELECINNGIDYRVIREDGKSFVITDDLKLNRLNLEITEKKITKVSIG